MSEQMRGAVGDGLEQAVRAYETALAEAELGRHTRSDEEPDQLRALRMEVVRQTEALPSGSWPRTRCAHCGGQREVAAVHAQYGTDASPQFVTSRRRCPPCWGTGLTLNVQQLGEQRQGYEDDP